MRSRSRGDPDETVMQRIVALQEAIAAPNTSPFVRVQAEKTIDARLRWDIGEWRSWSGGDHVAYALTRAADDAPTIVAALGRHGREASILSDEERRTIETILTEAEQMRSDERGKP